MIVGFSVEVARPTKVHRKDHYQFDGDPSQMFRYGNSSYLWFVAHLPHSSAIPSDI